MFLGYSKWWQIKQSVSGLIDAECDFSGYRTVCKYVSDTDF